MLTVFFTLFTLSIFFCLFRMIDWLSWPLAQHVDTWVIALLKGLAAVQKFTILIDVTLLKIELVCSENFSFWFVTDFYIYNFLVDINVLIIALLCQPCQVVHSVLFHLLYLASLQRKVNGCICDMKTFFTSFRRYLVVCGTPLYGRGRLLSSPICCSVSSTLRRPSIW